MISHDQYYSYYQLLNMNYQFLVLGFWGGPVPMDHSPQLLGQWVAHPMASLQVASLSAQPHKHPAHKDSRD